MQVPEAAVIGQRPSWGSKEWPGGPAFSTCTPTLLKAQTCSIPPQAAPGTWSVPGPALAQGPERVELEHFIEAGVAMKL